MLLALELYFQATGCRYNLIQKLTIGEVLTAAKVPRPCKHCNKETADYRGHRRKCRTLRRAQLRGEVIADDEAPRYDREIRFKRHKSFRGASLPVVVDSQLHRLLKLWIRQVHPDEEDPNVFVFGTLRWRRLLRLLAMIVGKKIMQNAKDSGEIGSKAMRQYAATVFLRRSATPQAAMRRIGGSETMAFKHYEDQTASVAAKLKDKDMLLEVGSSSSSSGEDTPEESDDEASTESGEDSRSEHSDGGSQSKCKAKGKLRPGQQGKLSNPEGHSLPQPRSSTPVPQRTPPETSASSEEDSDRSELSKGVPYQASRESRSSSESSHDEEPPVVAISPSSTPPSASEGGPPPKALKPMEAGSNAETAAAEVPDESEAGAEVSAEPEAPIPAEEEAV